MGRPHAAGVRGPRRQHGDGESAGRRRRRREPASEYGWTPLLVATQNRYYKLGVYLLDHGADPNIANKGGWTPLYIATDNRNIEGGDYPTRKPDMDHLEYIKLLLAAQARTRTAHALEHRDAHHLHEAVVLEEGATPFLRAAQSGDIVLMKLLLEHGADPKIRRTTA